MRDAEVVRDQGSWRCAEPWIVAGLLLARAAGDDVGQSGAHTRPFERLSFAAGVPPIRLHDLRHGAATPSLAAGNDMKTTSAMLRHSSLAMTSDLYTAVLPEVAHAAAEASAALVPRSTSLQGLSATGGLPSVSLASRAAQPPNPRDEKPPDQLH
ncbi:tyrosine-type recombinase/integrase [Nonomuraea rubra]|uniref:Tyr recombinase domain-containing protein n=1 Tax=Nonomuraea rubra TaxID=46180 RepID=A0A7X0U091_9ACTN|nr:tyrosine-type recombinase/integrase [Nonomuraea rubra]MBB6550124.1 hypothetical protein [Nonomuraea rubra]